MDIDGDILAHRGEDRREDGVRMDACAGLGTSVEHADMQVKLDGGTTVAFDMIAIQIVDANIVLGNGGVVHAARRNVDKARLTIAIAHVAPRGHGKTTLEHTQAGLLHERLVLDFNIGSGCHMLSSL